MLLVAAAEPSMAHVDLTHVYYAFDKMQRSCNFYEVSITLYKACLILEQVLQAVRR